MKLKRLLAIVALGVVAALPAKAYEFTDSLGNKVRFDSAPVKVAPSGKIAQYMMLTFDKTRLGGLSGKIGDKITQFVGGDFSSLPVFGQFYGGKSPFNPEAVMKAAPDVILDMGEAKKTIKADLKGVQDVTGIPTLFIQATLTDMNKAYRMMGELLNEPERGEAMGRYADEVYLYAAAHKSDMAKAPSVYIASGDDGLSTNARGSFHAQVLDLVGLTNAADLKFSTKGAGTQVSMEQLINWQPGVIVCDSAEVKKLIETEPAWQALDAVKAGKVFLTPDKPYNIVFNPPASNRLLGVYWLGHIAAPDVYNFDMKDKLRENYKLFYGVDLTDEQAAAILGE